MNIAPINALPAAWAMVAAIGAGADHWLWFLALPGWAFLGVGVAHWLWFLALPGWILKGKGPTARDRLRPYLDLVLATPSLAGGWIKLSARLLLLQLHVEQARHEEVLTTCRRLLAMGLAPGLEAKVRHHLADSLEALDDPDAGDERRRARDCLKGVEDDPATSLARGTLLAKQDRHEEAYDLFEAGLELIPPGMPSEIRVLLLLNMAFAAYNAGRIADAARDGERAIAQGAEGDALRTAHRHAATCLKALGRLEEAEAHLRNAYEVARAQREPRALADSLASLAGILHERGKLAEALHACDEVAAAHPDHCRQAQTVRYQILKDWGRFDEAAAALERARGLATLAIPHFERRTQAVFDMGAAWIALDQGQPDQAEASVRRAEPALGGDPKLSLWVFSASARIAALRGDRDAYLHVFEQARAGAGRFPGDVSTLRTIWMGLGKAAVALDDFPRALDCWEWYLALDPYPTDRTTALYHLGLCHEGLGDLQAARAAFREATTLAIDTHHARLAQARLRDLPIP